MTAEHVQAILRGSLTAGRTVHILHCLHYVLVMFSGDAMNEI